MKELVLAVVLVGAAAGGILILELLARLPVAVAAIVLIYGGIATIFSIDLRFAFGSITVFPPDMIFTLVAGAALIRILGLPRFSPVQASLVTISLLALFSVARGSVSDFASAVNEFRAMFYFLSTAMYFVTVELTDTFLRHLKHLLYACALLVLIGAVILWGEFLSGTSLPDAFANPWEGGFRVITADQTMLLAQASLIALPAWINRKGSTFERFLPMLFVPAVVLLQWRVVWILFIVGLVVLGIKSKALGFKVLIPIMVALAASTFILPRVFTGDDRPSIAESFETTTESAEGTFLWRVEGWQELTKNGPQSTSEVFLGAPFGRGLDRVVSGQEVTSQAHSFYLDHYLRLGLIGLIILVGVYGFAFVRLVRSTSVGRGLSDPSIMLVLVVTQIIVFITFTPGEEQGLLAGVLLAYAAQRRSLPGSVPIAGRRHQGWAPKPAST